jgi:hypothetical protein
MATSLFMETVLQGQNLAPIPEIRPPCQLDGLVSMDFKTKVDKASPVNHNKGDG